MINLNNGTLVNTADSAITLSLKNNVIAPCGYNCAGAFYDMSFTFDPPIDYFYILALDAEESFAYEAYFEGSLINPLCSVTTIGSSSINTPGGSSGGAVKEVICGEIGGSAVFDEFRLTGLGGGPELWDFLKYNQVEVDAPNQCPKAGYQDIYSILSHDSSYYVKSTGTNGGTNKFEVDKKCDYLVSGQNVGGKERFPTPSEWLNRACSLFSGSVVDHSVTFNGIEAPTASDISNDGTTVTISGPSLDGMSLSCTFPSEVFATSYKTFLSDIVTNGSNVFLTNDSRRCGSGPLCIDLVGATAYTILPADVDGSSFQFCVDSGETIPQVVTSCTFDACEFIEYIALEHNCGEPIRRGTCMHQQWNTLSKCSR